MAQTLKAFVQRGKEVDVTLMPHRYADGCYVASQSRFEQDYVRVDTIEKLIDLWKQGYKIRMSDPESKHHRSPSLIASGAIELSLA
jgi:hypothetical protein